MTAAHKRKAQKVFFFVHVYGKYLTPKQNQGYVKF